MSRLLQRVLPVVIGLLAAVSLGAQVHVMRPSAGQGPVISGLTLICKGTETTLKVEGDYESFEWSTGSTERFIKVNKEGIYEVTVRTKGGCSLTSSVNVQERICTK